MGGSDRLIETEPVTVKLLDVEIDLVFVGGGDSVSVRVEGGVIVRDLVGPRVTELVTVWVLETEPLGVALRVSGRLIVLVNEGVRDLGGVFETVTLCVGVEVGVRERVGAGDTVMEADGVPLHEAVRVADRF